MDKKKIRYAILKTLEEKNDPVQVLTNSGITKEDILEQSWFLEREKYVTKHFGADNIIYTWGQVTEKGEKYLEDNSILSKAYKLAKEAKDWIPFW